MDKNDLSLWQASDRFPITTSDDPMFHRVVAAMEGDQWLEVIYFGGDNPGQTRRIKPLEVFGVKGQYQVYVRAFCATRNEERTFRLDKLTVLTEDRDPKPQTTPVSRPKPASIEDKILDLLATAPGLKAGQIATRVGVEKRTVNSLLHGKLSGKVLQDTAYRWSLRSGQTQESARRTEPQKDTPLAKLCRYYLECLAQDADTGISVLASSQFSLDYVPVRELPLADKPQVNILDDESSASLLRKVRSDRTRLQLYLGYPVRLNRIRSRKGWEGFTIEPLFLFPFHLDPVDRNAPPTLALSAPQLNFRLLKSLSTTDSGNMIDEAIELSEELGLSNPDADIPDLDDLVARLRIVRQSWDWREDPDPYALSSEPPLSDIDQPGIYNRAVLVTGERSPYTQGLETELAALAKLDEDDYSQTALGSWLRGETGQAATPQGQPLLEILPLNTEQRQSVLRGLSNQLTIITGPPGTGKSQVVTSLLANAAWQGKKILFASKNNKAVDVVEIRTNAIGPRPILLRLGAGEYQNKLSEYLTSLLSATATSEDEKAYQTQLQVHNSVRGRFQQLDTEVSAVIELRNEVHRLAQDTEKTRTELGETAFKSFRSLDTTPLRSAAAALEVALHRADKPKQPFLLQLAWPLISTGRYSHLADVADQSTSLFQTLRLSPPSQPRNPAAILEWRDFVERLSKRLNAVENVQRYFTKLHNLSTSRPLEVLSREYTKLVDELSDTSEQLWHCWLRLQPNRLTQQERRLLSEYSSLLQIIVATKDSNQTADARVFRQYHAAFPNVVAILSCWAVTSLSARGRIPLQPAFFDVLVIDEASQCDIASALPLLYRAKRAVIIGDPQQLKHISSISPKQDRALLAKHNLVEGNLAWGYSGNSLFDVARSMCRTDDIISLRDHHRSHADIIGFSNQHFYGGLLRIATRYERLKLLHPKDPSVRWIDIRGKVVRPPDGAAVNSPEAEAVVKELEHLVIQQNYRGTVGVVTPFRSQANRIRDLVHQNDALASRLDQMEFLVNTVHQFQGDERDLIIFSPVVSKGIADSALRFLSNNPYLFNVAVTRARAALLVIGDRQAAIDSGVDYLKKFAIYAESLGSQPSGVTAELLDFGPEYPPVSNPERVSDWERVFYRQLYAAGVRTMPQYNVDQYALDLALLKDHRRLDIEVDGEHHRDWDGEVCRRDQIRNQRLMELGWDVMRFWVYQIRDETDECISRVQRWITQ